MDPKTRLILFKLVDGGILEEVNGCISTGKEANVYHASGGRLVLPYDNTILIIMVILLVLRTR